MTTIEKPRYRYGPDGCFLIEDPDLPLVKVRALNANERILRDLRYDLDRGFWHIFDPRETKHYADSYLHGITASSPMASTLDGGAPKPRILDPFSPVARQAFERVVREAERQKNIDWGWRKEYSGELPGFSIWTSPHIVHVSWVPLCYTRTTACSIRIGRRWKEAVGLLPFEDKRLCLRCQHAIAMAQWRAFGKEGPEPSARDFRRDEDERWWFRDQSRRAHLQEAV